MIKLGEKVKDRISGFTGIYTGRTTFLNNCVRSQVTAQKLKDGKTIEQWFDESDLIKIGNGINKPKKEGSGGPRHHSPQRKDVTRL